MEGGAKPTQEELGRMVNAIQHRGPDGFGYYSNEVVGLGHARLSIIDIDGGAQPIHNEDKTVWVSFNGEIFNYVELRQDLESLGHQFYTETDTEVIVHAYEQYGESFPEVLNGQFAISLWDDRARKLVLVRDRTGILPLFYTMREKRLIFGSEVKAILTTFDQAPRLNPAALDQIMTFWGPVGDTCIFEGIRQVVPGEIIVVKNDQLARRKYWSWEYPTSGQYLELSEDESAERLYDVLDDATRIRLRSDVPVGAYLSGGLDSSVITALVHHQGAHLRTFSVGFEDRDYDETSYQDLMIKHIDAEHSRLLCRNEDISASFRRTVWHTETPILRTAAVPMMLLSEMVHENGRKVILTGEGADEVLGGYDLFKEAKIREFWARNIESDFRPMLLKRLYPYLDLSSKTGLAYQKAFFGVGLDDPHSPFFSHMPRWNTTSHCKLFFSSGLKDQLRKNATEEFCATFPKSMAKWHSFNRGQYIEAKSLMSGYLLCSQGDRMLMANSVEGRFPFLDHRVIELASQLHPRLKMKVLNEKYMLKKSMRHLLPKEIVSRYKQPYRAPDAPAFAEGEGSDYVQELLGAAAVESAGYFDVKRVGHLVKKVQSGRAIGAKDNMAFVGILSTQIWHQHFVKQFHENFRAA